MNSDLGRNVNTSTFQTGFGCNLDIGTIHATKSHLKKEIVWQGENLKIL